MLSNPQALPNMVTRSSGLTRGFAVTAGFLNHSTLRSEFYNKGLRENYP